MAGPGFALFDTALGSCGIAWTSRGVAAVQLPEPTPAQTRARLLGRLPAAREAAPPAAVARAGRAVTALLAGAAADLSAVVLDMSGIPPFHRRVYELVRTLPWGATLSYGEVAIQLGAPGAARAVGQAMRHNPFAMIVPCHRVVAAGGGVGGFSADGGVTTKLRLLALEGVRPGGLFTAGGSRLGFDPEVAVAHLRAGDPALARLIDAVGPCRMELQTATSVFAALAEAIVYQQLSGRAAATIFARLCALFPGGRACPTPAQILRAPDATLRSAGLSGAKTLALRDLAARAVAGRLPSLTQAAGMSDEAIIERLVEVRGIGRWTAEMFLMFRLGRPDVLPLDDLGVRRGFAVALGGGVLPDRAELEQRAQPWRPYRTAASWYLWRAAETRTLAAVGVVAAAV